jgi:hypothetical protein
VLSCCTNENNKRESVTKSSKLWNQHSSICTKREEKQKQKQQHKRSSIPQDALKVTGSLSSIVLHTQHWNISLKTFLKICWWGTHWSTLHAKFRIRSLYANKNDVCSLLEMHVEIASASIQVGGGGKGQENKEEEVDNHPLASARFLEILIFLVEPL